ncbi:hypothetical protein PR048_004594, partial [Dryococelus australis]
METYFFDKNITKDKLFKEEVEESGFKVVAVASDMGDRNLSLWKNLQISTNKVSFMNPVEVTNNFLDYGIRLPCGTEVSKWQFQQILHDKELSLTPELDSTGHFNISGSARQN